MNDGKLIRALKRGQRGALDRAISRYSGYVASVARSVLGARATHEDLEEIVSDVFVSLWRAAERLNEERDTLKSYLAVIARHAAIDRLRRQKPEDPLPEDDLLIADEAEGPEAFVLRRESAQTLRALLAEMAADDREIFIRFYYCRQTVREIAETIGMNESTVKARLSRGRLKLRERLTKEVDGVSSSASVSLRGATYLLTSGSSRMTQNGASIYISNGSAAQIIDDVFYVSQDALAYGLGVYVVGYRMRESGYVHWRSAKPGEARVWIIAP